MSPSRYSHRTIIACPHPVAGQDAEGWPLRCTPHCQCQCIQLQFIGEVVQTSLQLRGRLCAHHCSAGTTTPLLTADRNTWDGLSQCTQQYAVVVSATFKRHQKRPSGLDCSANSCRPQRSPYSHHVAPITPYFTAKRAGSRTTLVTAMGCHYCALCTIRSYPRFVALEAQTP